MYEERRRKLIDCPGDVISYKCEIRSNSEEVHLIWNITSPGVQPIMIQYNSSSNQSVIDDFGIGISSIVTQYITDEYIESFLFINVMNNSLNTIHLECLIANLSIARKTVLLRVSGMCITHSNCIFVS